MVDAKSRVVYDNGTVVYNNTIDEIRGENDDQNNQQTKDSNDGQPKFLELLSYVIGLVIIVMLVFAGYVGYRKMQSGREEEITW